MSQALQVLQDKYWVTFNSFDKVCRSEDTGTSIQFQVLSLKLSRADLFDVRTPISRYGCPD